MYKCSVIYLCVSALVLVACDNSSQIAEPEQPRSRQLTLDLRPVDAEVFFPGLNRAYEAGMALDYGRYMVDLSHPQYVSERRWIEHDGRSQPEVYLRPKTYPLIVDTWPYGTVTTVTSLASAEQWTWAEGLELLPGDYRARVEKAGYEPAEQRFTVVLDGEAVTLNVVLTALPKNPGDRFRDGLASGGQGPEMVVIPAGEFEMGDAVGKGGFNELPLHPVQIGRPFAVSLTEVTIGQYRQFVNDRKIVSSIAESDDPLLPVSNVSWWDAQAFVNWLTEQTGERYRLLSETEWEYVARAGVQGDYTWGETVNCEQARFDAYGRCGEHGATQVGRYSANTFGLFDVHGNVWEWVQDCYSLTYDETPRDQRAFNQADCIQRTVRGGSWILNGNKIRLSYRNWRAPEYRNDDTGIRVARDL